MDLPFASSFLEHWVSLRARQRPIRPLAELDLTGIDRVLLALTTGLGDAILSTPVFESVRSALPQSRIGLFVRASWAPLFLNEPDLDEIIPYPGKWRRFFSTLDSLRTFSPQLTLVLHGNDPDILPLVYLAGSQFIIRIPTAGTRYASLLSNSARKEDSHVIAGWHYIDNRLRILDSVGIPHTRTTPILRPSKDKRASDWLRAVCEKQPYVVVHPWAADDYKTWPITQARRFLEEFETAFPEHLVVITGSRADDTKAKELAEGLGHVRLAAGKFGIEGAAFLISGAKAVVAPDTGILHMAAALDVPTVGLFAPTNPDFVGQRAESAVALSLVRPLTCSPCVEKKCSHHPAKCMSQFAASDVIAALKACLEERP